MTAAAEIAETETPPPRGLRRTVRRNVAWNWAHVVVEAAVGFVVAPFLIHSLGDTSYGLWILIGSLTSYFGMLDFGLRGSVGRHIALYRARGDAEGVQSTISTAAAVLCGIGSLAFLGVLAAAWLFPSFVDVPAADVASVRWALVIVGVQLLLFFVLQLFDAALWACQRFDLLNAVDIPIALLRGGLTLYFVTTGSGLVALATITLSTTVVQGILKACLTARELRGLPFSASHVSRSICRELLGYGVWLFIINVAGMARSKLSPFVVGGMLGAALVTPFSIAARLVSLATMFVVAAAGVVTPISTGLHATNDAHRQRRLFIDGTRHCVAIALSCCGCYFLLGRTLLVLWVGERHAGAWGLLAILAAGELLPISAEVARNVLVATARHRPLAWLGCAESLISLGVGALAMHFFGLVGLCVVMACAGAVCRGAIILHQCRRSLGITVTELAGAFLRPVAAWIGPAVLLAVATKWHVPTSWIGLICYGSCFAAGHAVTHFLVERLSSADVSSTVEGTAPGLAQ